MKYPGHIIKKGESDSPLVTVIAKALSAFGYAVDASQSSYDTKLAAYVRLFQSQHYDAAGRPLIQDGEVGPLTWAALFGAESVDEVVDSLAGSALRFAIGEVGVMEVPKGSNRGKRVEQYQASVNCPPGTFWCMAFVHFCFQTAAKDRGIANPFPATGGVLDAWRRVNKTQKPRILSVDMARHDPGLVRPGMVFILDHGGGLGHTGFVRSAAGGAFRTVEGNSNPDGSNNGIGVFDINRRKVTSKELKGFIDFTGT